jgi:ADP-ribose pyrophosphatase YjhB (NUDIX family)
MTRLDAAGARTLGTNPFWSYRVQEIGDAQRYYFIDVPDSVLALPVSTRARVLLVKQARPALNVVTLEFPGGSLRHGESVIEGAMRELAEETGLSPGATPYLVATLAPSTGCSTERCHVVAMPMVDELSALAEPGLELQWAEGQDVLGLLLRQKPADAVAVAAWAAFGGEKEADLEAL